MTLRFSRRKHSLSGNLVRRRRAKSGTNELKLESLEPRQLLAFGPQLLGIQPNTGSLLADGDTRNIAPSSLTFNFDARFDLNEDTVDGIRFTRSGFDGVFGDANDVIVTPGFIGLGDRPNEVVVRFAETLPDDQYQIEIFGFDSPSQGIKAVRNVNNEPFMPADPAADRTTIGFELDLGAQIVAVVPQPITRNADGSLSQARNQIEVYFNNDNLHDSAVETGDISPNPSVVDPRFYKLISTFGADGVATVNNADDIEIQPDSISYDPATNRAAATFSGDISALEGEGAYRLRIGTTETTPAPPSQLFEISEIGDSFDTSVPLPGSVLAGAVNISASISPQFYPLNFPGIVSEPGHRDVSAEQHVGGPEGSPGTAVSYFNFQDTLPGGFQNAITEEQKELARQIYQIYGYYLGVQFVESDTRGTIVATGDLRAADPMTPSGPGGVAGLGGGGIAIMDKADNLGPGFGGGWFNVAIHEIGHAIGLGHAYDLPPGTIQGDAGSLAGFGVGNEPVFPGNHDIVHGRLIYRPEGKDIDIYNFDVAETGRFTADIIAERQTESSLLDSALTLYRENADGTREVIARNDDYFSEDSHLDLTLEPGTYFIAVSASGNTSFDPNREDSGIGGRSEGDYDLRLNFRPIANEVIVDATGVEFDGNADGTPGGTYNFWFTAADEANTIFVDKLNQPAAGAPAPDGSLANPFNEIDVAFSAASPGDIVRIVGNGGSDNNIDTLHNNQPYLIGTNPFVGGALADGSNLQAPRGVTVMIDAGAIFKLQSSFISTGSNSVLTDLSGSALQVLGTPSQSVYFTSYHDESIGLDTNPTVLQTPSAGQWGGLVFRADVDNAQGNFSYERRGVFLNYVNHADIRYGGGQVTLGSVPQRVAPLFMAESRPTLTFNNITDSAQAAISADPNSFQESQFLVPEFQAVPFTPDYSRVGPDIHGNRLTSNTTNGLFVRIATLDGAGVKPLTVAARFDDTDIVHVLTENLTVQGTAGGGIAADVAPPVVLVALSEVAGGSLAAGTYSYRITYVDSNGNESGASNATESITTTGGSVRLDNLPTVEPGFVARRIYRENPASPGTFNQIAQIGPTTTSFVDVGQTAGGPLVDGGAIRSRTDASLVIDPGTIIKSNSSRIDVVKGANLIAEATDGREIIFTSLRDDSFGASGTFDTNADGANTTPAPGNWSGIYVGHTSTASIDHAFIAYGGGSAQLNGSNAGSNVIEIQQATVRIANSDIRNNRDGSNGSGETRSGRLGNAVGTIFVRGAQPVIVGNEFRNNGGPVININVDALNHELQTDYGRSTGLVDAVPGNLGNHGPLIQNNRLSNNSINGMQIRAESLTTQSVWDDTDMVHVVSGQIVSPDFHTFGGLRLQSSPGESLVVKFTSGSGLTATGRNFDIDDRIGGTVQVVGQPGAPVVLTALGDNTIGAGFDVNGLSQTDTANTGSLTASPGDWAGVTFAQNANDRNVGIVTEYENPTLSAPGSNAVVDTAQLLGRLAAGEHASDDTNRLGFEIHGQLNQRSDIDTYSFFGTAGTQVWLDIDRSTHALDTIVELIDDQGQVLARVDNSYEVEQGGESVYELNDSILAHGLVSVPQRPHDYWGTNPYDAGLRVVLPGATGSTGLFYIRVRSSSDNVAGSLLGGETAGKYQLQLRLRDIDEIPGSTVKFADIRYATNGVTVEGQPQHSPLLGEAAETGAAHGDTASAQDLGNLLNSDRAALSVNGNIAGGGELDFYEFNVTYDGIQVIPGANDGPNYDGVTFDIDYADGLGRADTILSIYDANMNLIFTSRNASINQDIPKPFNGIDVDDLSRGSVGSLDPFIGTVELGTGTYFAAVSSNARIPVELDQFFRFTPTNSNLRLEPVNSVRRIAEDHILSDFFSTAEAPQVPVLFDNSSFVPYQLGDVTLFVVEDAGNDSTRVRTVDPFTGAQENIVGVFGRDVGDLAMRSDGVLTAFALDLDVGGIADTSAGNFLEISTGDASVGVLNDDGIVTFQEDPATAGAVQAANDGVHFNATTFFNTSNGRQLFAVGDRGGPPANGIDPTRLNNILYMFNDSGVATGNGTGNRANAARLNGSGTDVVERGIIDTTAGDGMGGAITGLGGSVTGMTMLNGRMFAVSDRGDLFEITGFTGTTAQTQFIAHIDDVSFQGLTLGPAGAGGQHAQTLFGITDIGDIYAFDSLGDAVPTFLDGASMISTGSTSVRGLAFSTLSNNPWKFTDDRGGDAGHGVAAASDDSRAPAAGENSLYFGQLNGMGNADNNFDFPGGAHGSVVSNPFSLEGYSAIDQPVLYFNYFLDTEAAAYSPGNPTELFRDSLRTYIQKDDGQWQLVATNNEFSDPDEDDEFDQGGVTLLHDNTDTWRQARVNLAQFSGMTDLRLRFDFDTAGGLNTGSEFFTTAGFNSGLTTGAELHAVPGLDIRDGDTFVIDSADALIPPAQFEFDSGFTLVAPAGKNITEGERFTIVDRFSFSRTYELDLAGNGPNGTGAIAIAVNESMSASEVATAIRNAIGGSFVTRHLNGERLNLNDAQNVTQTGGTSLSIEGSEFPLDPTATQIPVHEDMTSAEVAEVIHTALADVYSMGDTNFFYRDRDMIRLIGHSLVVNGPLQVVESLAGDQFGAFNASTLANGNTNATSPGFLRGQNNTGEGAYIDDIIIGFAERGEMVTNAAGNDTFTTNPSHSPDTDVLVGNYQLEIRRSQEYGLPTGNPDLPFLGLVQSFDTNDRFAEQLSLRTNAGNDIAPGDTFTIGDTRNELTFEFTDTGLYTPGNVPVLYSVTDSAADIAHRVRDAINSSASRNVLQLVANDASGSLGNGGTSNLVHIYGEGVFIDSTMDRVQPVIYALKGDDNRFRDQGMILIQSSYITDSGEFGIRNLPGSTTQPFSPQAGILPHAGPARVLDVINGSNVAPGIAITNNVIARNVAGGIDFAGDATGNSAVPVGRIVNNTIVGTGSGQGVVVRDNAAPTLLNNIISTFNQGVVISGTNANNVLVNGTVFHDTATTGKVGSNSLTVAGQLFRDIAANNYYLEAGTGAIDSGVDSMDDRAALLLVRTPLGIAPSPVKSPDTDITGLARGDDTTTPNTGSGENPFKDRGAIERSDVTGPTVELVNPRDNDAAGNDVDPTSTIVQSLNATLDVFTLQLIDSTTNGGSGVDPATVNGNSVVITENGRLLTENVEYRFSYSSTNGTIRLEPIAGIWNADSVYVISLNNAERSVVTVPAGSMINDGNTFGVTDALGNEAIYEFNSGFTLQIPQTLTLNIPATGGVADGQTFVLSNGVTSTTFEFDANGNFGANTQVDISAATTSDEIADAIVLAIEGQTQLGFTPRNLGDGAIHLGSIAGHTANATGSVLSVSGIAQGFADQDIVTVANDFRSVDIELDSNNNTTPGNRTLSFTAADTNEEIAERLAAAIENAVVGLSPVHVGGGFLHIGGTSIHSVTVSTASVVVSGDPAVTGAYQLQVPAAGGGAGGVSDAQQFTITRGTGAPVTFEFDSDNSSSVAPEQTIAVSLASSQNDIAQAIVDTLNTYASQVGWAMAPQNLGNGLIALNEAFGFELDASASTLTQSGVGGGAIAVPFVPHVSFDGPKVAEAIRDAINSGGQTGVQAQLRNGQELVIEGASAINDPTNLPRPSSEIALSIIEVQAIRDLANNPLQANQQSGATMFTILLGDPALDFGNAPDPTYPTLFSSNGARHALTNGLFLGSGVAGAVDGVTFNDILNANVETPITVTASEAGVLDAWLDFNGDGDWDDPGEQIFASKPIQAGANDLVVVPASAVAPGTTYARFRLSTSGNLTPSGLAADGEVEDYEVEIIPGTPPLANNDTYSTDEDTPISEVAPGVLANDSDADGDTVTVLMPESITLSSFGAAVEIMADGSFSYDPTGIPLFDALPDGATITDSFIYVATDGTLDSDPAVVFVEVSGLNDAPVANDDSYNAGEDTNLLIGSGAGLLSNDIDIDMGDTIAVTAIGGGTSLTGTSSLGAAVVANADGSFSYDPRGVADINALSAGETAIDTITYTIEDSFSETATATVTITVTGANDRPDAVNDSYTMNEDDQLIEAAPGLLDNDTDPDQNGSAPDDVVTITTLSVTSSRGVPVTLTADGSFTYDPRMVASIQSAPAGTPLVDTFSYRVSDGNGGTDVATVTITINGENDPPTANDDEFTASENFVLSVVIPGVLLNDDDLDQGDSISIQSFETRSQHDALVVMQPNGSFTYDPRNATDLQALSVGETLTDTFTYTLQDSSGATSIATVSVVVSGSNDLPVAVLDSFTANEDLVLSEPAPGVLVNDTDGDSGDSLTVFNYDSMSEQGATVVMQPDGSFTYDPRTSEFLQSLDTDEVFTDTFTYTVRDGSNATSTTTVQIMVSGENDPPEAGDDNYIVNQDNLLTIPAVDGLLDNDMDSEGGSDLMVTMVDDSGLEGTFVWNADGSFSYDPRDSEVLKALPQGAVSEVMVTYTVMDGGGETDTATVSIVVTGVNNAPEAADDSGFPTDEDSSLLISISELLSNDSDPDGDTLTLVPNATSNGGAAVTVVGTNVVYDPSGAFDSIPFGGLTTDQFTYTISDASGASSTATVTVDISGLNDNPTVSPLNFEVSEDRFLNPALPGLLLGASDVDSGDTLSISGGDPTSTFGATISYGSDGTLLYNPTNAFLLQGLSRDQTEVDTFSFMVNDNNGGSTVHTASVTVTGVNDVPDADDDFYSAFEKTVLNVSALDGVLRNDSDPDFGDSLTASVPSMFTDEGATITMNSDGSFSYDPTSSTSINALRSVDPPLTDRFTYTVTDTFGETRDADVEIVVSGINLHPWQNELNRLDVDGNGTVSNNDALIIVSRLRRTGTSALPVPPTPPIAPPPFYDVNGDDTVSLDDALQIVAFLTLQLREGEGEGESPSDQDSIAHAVEQASSKAIVSSGSDSLQPVKLANRSVVIEDVVDDASLDHALLACYPATNTDDAVLTQHSESSELSESLDSIADDISSEWA